MAKPQAPVQKKKREWDRGCLMTPQKRADQPEFRGQMEVRGDQMWCIACHVPVNHLEKSYGSVHIKSGAHKKNVARMPLRVTKPGPSAELLPNVSPQVCQM